VIEEATPWRGLQRVAPLFSDNHRGENDDR